MKFLDTLNDRLTQARDTAAMSILQPIRKIIPPSRNVIEFTKITFDAVKLTEEAASDAIYCELEKSKPSMIARFGMVELDCLTDCYYRNFSFGGIWRYLRSEIEHLGFSPRHRLYMARNAGFFSNSSPMMKRFARRMIKDIRQLDILGSWMAQEKVFDTHLKHVIKVRLRDLDPYYQVNPWSRILEGKRVLVVHPFEATILQQYRKRELLFPRSDVLPEFDLQIIKAVQTIAGTPTSYKHWFDALDSMVDQIEKRDFDIALIGCGAYGFPLAAHVKRMGKKAVHLGGALQMLFGIKGKRWEGSKFFNEHWVRPLDEDRPKGFDQIEKGCYW